ncbi:uncharacterized protein BDR25DRAFT_312650 [Lindgomyces ingoldianus]|uniref:Uncharacterized protein n=1 Tax=Lindgomyces ingoldianus TaxID=673940 RepID=A0ACB6R2J9_9PLEO|nr:uncharacterized protein BDR25DRAFT_312650 [Lindgomyces ingoldianus]KAF2472737.1 hypothetical protein BDR25DRAFT_312650 [Lindgomyces ingoldianus]
MAMTIVTLAHPQSPGHRQTHKVHRHEQSSLDCHLNAVERKGNMQTMNTNAYVAKTSTCATIELDSDVIQCHHCQESWTALPGQFGAMDLGMRMTRGKIPATTVMNMAILATMGRNKEIIRTMRTIRMRAKARETIKDIGVEIMAIRSQMDCGKGEAWAEGDYVMDARKEYVSECK